MSASDFDPSEAVTFDLAYGHVHLDGAPTRIMVPADALAKLCAAAGQDATAALVHAMGNAMGRRVAVRLSGGSDRRDAVRAAGLERVVEHLAGELALAGLGALSAERWGRALVFVVDQSPVAEEGDVLLEGILQAAIHALTGKEQSCMVKLHREGVRARFLVVASKAVAAVRARLDKGDSWGSVLAALHPGGPAA